MKNYLFLLLVIISLFCLSGQSGSDMDTDWIEPLIDAFFGIIYDCLEILFQTVFDMLPVVGANSWEVDVVVIIVVFAGIGYMFRKYNVFEGF